MLAKISYFFCLFISVVAVGMTTIKDGSSVVMTEAGVIFIAPSSSSITTEETTTADTLETYYTNSDTFMLAEATESTSNSVASLSSIPVQHLNNVLSSSTFSDQKDGGDDVGRSTMMANTASVSENIATTTMNLIQPSIRKIHPALSSFAATKTKLPERIKEIVSKSTQSNGDDQLHEITVIHHQQQSQIPSSSSSILLHQQNASISPSFSFSYTLCTRFYHLHSNDSHSNDSNINDTTTPEAITINRTYTSVYLCRQEISSSARHGSLPNYRQHDNSANKSEGKSSREIITTSLIIATFAVQIIWFIYVLVSNTNEKSRMLQWENKHWSEKKQVQAYLEDIF